MTKEPNQYTTNGKTIFTPDGRYLASARSGVEANVIKEELNRLSKFSLNKYKLAYEEHMKTVEKTVDEYNATLE